MAVITVHSVTFIERYDFEAPKLWRNLNETLTLYRMPILIFLSGMLLPRSLEKPTLDYFYGKARAILWPFLLWSTIYALFTGVNFSSAYELRRLYTGNSHLWFLGFIFIYYIIAKPIERINFLLVATGAFIFSLASPDGDKYSERIFFLMSLFFLGAAASCYKNIIMSVVRSSWVWSITPFIAVSAYVTVIENLSFGPYWVILSAMGFIFFAAIAQRLETTTISKPLIWIGQRSIIFYVSHAIIIIITSRIFEGLEITSYVFTALVAIVFSLAGGWALAVAERKFFYIRWLFIFPKGILPASESMR